MADIPMIPMRVAIDRYLQSLPCSLYGRAFDINSADSRAACVEWMFNEMANIGMVVSDMANASSNGHVIGLNVIDVPKTNN